MAGLADELRAGIDEAARKMAEARLADDDYGPGLARAAVVPAAGRPAPGC
jgi:hypothetical protein